MLLEPSRFSCPRASAEDNELEIVLFSKSYGICKGSTKSFLHKDHCAGHILASVLLVRSGDKCAFGSNVRVKGLGSSPRKNSSGVLNLIPTLLARSLP